MVVEVGEDLDKNGHWQADHEYAGDHAREAEEATEERRRTVVAVADGGERDDGVPEGVYDAYEVVVARIVAGEPLGVEYERAEESGRDDEEEAEQLEDGGALFDARDDHLQTRVVAEQAEETEHAHHLHRLQHAVLLHVDVDEVAEHEPRCGHYVDQIVQIVQIGRLVGRHQEANRQVDHEPCARHKVDHGYEAVHAVIDHAKRGARRVASVVEARVVC